MRGYIRAIDVNLRWRHDDGTRNDTVTEQRTLGAIIIHANDTCTATRTMPASARHQDQNGFLLVKGCPIASFGILQYSAAQLGLDGDPNRIVNVYRPESEVSNQEYLDSFQIVPMINDHEMLSGFQDDETAAAPEQKGVDGVLINVCYKQPWVNGDLKIFSRSMQADLNGGKKDLSLGYTCDFELKSGTWNGKDYEAIQTNMRGNHIALVDAGRVPGARVLDGKKLCFDHLDFKAFTTTGVADMPKGRVTRRAADSTVVQQLQAQLKALLPTFEQFLNEEATEPAHQAGAEGSEGAAGAGGAEGAGAAASAEGGETGTGEVAAAGAPGATEEGEGETDTGGEGAAGAEGAEGSEGASGEGEMSLEDALDKLEGLCAAIRKARAGAQGDGEGEEGEGAENAEGAANDTTEGLEGTTREGTDGEGEGANLGEGGQGRASAGPAGGKHEGADAALRTFYADAAAKDRLYGRLSKVVGAFDAAVDVASATSADIARYGVKKLGIKCAKGTEVIALDAYLTGIEKARNHASQTVNKQRAADAAAQEVPAIDAYFKE